MTHALITIDVAPPDDKGECEVVVKLLREIHVDEDGAERGGTYAHHSAGTVQINTPRRSVEV